MIDIPVITVADACVSGITSAMVSQQVPNPAIMELRGKEARGFVAQMLVLAKKEGFQPAPVSPMDRVAVHPMPNYALVITYQDDCVTAVARVPVEMYLRLREYRYAEGDENSFTAEGDDD